MSDINMTDQSAHNNQEQDNLEQNNQNLMQNLQRRLKKRELATEAGKNVKRMKIEYIRLIY